MTHLYELSNAYKMLQETDELTQEELNEALNNIGELFSEKASNIGKLTLSLQSDAEAIDSELKRLGQRKQALDNRVKGLKFYLAQEMEATNIDKVKNEVLTISLRSNPPSVNVVDSDSIPTNFRVIIPESWQPDKKAIIEYFKETGLLVGGTEVISDKKHVVIK